MKKIIFITIFIVLAIPVLSYANGGDLDSEHHNGMMGNMMGNWGMGAGWNWLGWVFMVLILVILVLVIIFLIKQITK